MAMGVFYLAIPVGAAIGYVAGGVIGDMFGWRAAFLCCGAPGLLVSTHHTHSKRRAQGGGTRHERKC